LDFREVCGALGISSDQELKDFERLVRPQIDPR
jgi:hypothetical protein